MTDRPFDPVRDLTPTEEAIYRALAGAEWYLNCVDIARLAYDYAFPDAVDCRALINAHLSHMRAKGVPVVTRRGAGYRLGALSPVASLLCVLCGVKREFPAHGWGRVARQVAIAAGWVLRSRSKPGGWYCPACLPPQNSRSTAYRRARYAEAREVAL